MITTTSAGDIKQRLQGIASTYSDMAMQIALLDIDSDPISFIRNALMILGLGENVKAHMTQLLNDFALFAIQGKQIQETDIKVC